MNHGAIEARVCGDATPRIFKYADECSVPSCSHKLNNTRFYKVPRNHEMARLYRESMNIAEGVDVSSWNICEDHFSENDFVSFGNVRTLKIVAIPSRNLPKLKRGQPFFLEKGAAGGQKLGELVSNTQLTLIGQSELQQRRTRPKFQDSKLQVQKIQEELRLLGQAWIKENKMPAKIAEAQEIAKNAQHQKDPIDEYQLVSLPELTKLENTLCSICLETKREKMKDVNALFQGQPIKLVIEFTFSIEVIVSNCYKILSFIYLNVPLAKIQ